MNIPKKLIGKEVRIHWMDPRGLRTTSHDIQHHSDILQGTAALCRWVERGMIEKVVEGVVYLQQSLGYDPPLEPEQEHTLLYSLVPEALIEKVEVMQVVETLPVPPPIEPATLGG